MAVTPPGSPVGSAPESIEDLAATVFEREAQVLCEDVPPFDDITRDQATASRTTVTPARGTGLILAGVVLIAANLRLVVGGTGPLLDSLRDSLHLSSAVVSLLPALWVICFSIAGLTGASLARRFGSGPTLAAALVLLAAGSAARALPDTAALLAGSAVAAVGIALANVLLPAAVRTYFPHRIGAVTGVYTTALSAGSALAAALAVPAAHAFGGASEGLIVWAPPAVLALLVWSLSGRARRAHATRQAADGTARPHIPLRNLLRSRLAWTMAVFFGLQSTSAYVVMGWLPTILHDDGLSTSAAGTVLSVGLLVSIPLSLLAPLLAVRLGDSRPLVWLLSASFAAGFAGLDVAATGGAYLWAVLLGVGMAVFPLVLARLGVLGGSPAGTAALSTFAQGVGYLIAAIGPYGLGLLRNAVGSWTVPLVLMAGVATLQAVIGGYVMSPRRRAIAPGTVETGGRR